MTLPLVHAMLQLAESAQLSSLACHRRFGVGRTWLADVRSNRVKSPTAYNVQSVIEGLTGEPLLSPDTFQQLVDRIGAAREGATKPLADTGASA